MARVHSHPPLTHTLLAQWPQETLRLEPNIPFAIWENAAQYFDLT